MDVRIVDLPPVNVAFLRKLGPYDESIPRFWDEVAAPWMRENRLRDYARYGICHDNPSTTPAAQCRYDTGVAWPEDRLPPVPASCEILPGGLYAVLPFSGTAATIKAAWQFLIQTWLSQSDYRMVARPSFEHYPPGIVYDESTGVFSCDICIPITTREENAA